jgi:carbonic anhydrase
METLQTADAALKKLIDGNRRFISGSTSHPHQDRKRLQDVISGQNPFAIILGCSDSRVPPEVIFDQGIGDLFIIRTAGHVVDDVVLGSIEYAVDHLGVPLLIVLGHQNCGAVQASIQSSSAPAHMSKLTSYISPVIKSAAGQNDDLMHSAVIANVRYTVDLLKQNEPLLAASIRNGKLKIYGSVLNFENGVVDFW